MADKNYEEDVKLAEKLERAAKLLRVGNEGRGTTSWYQATYGALYEVAAALRDAGVKLK